MGELLTIPETAERLGISTKAVEKRIERGTIQSLRRDGRRVVPGGEIERVQSQGKPLSVKDFPRSGTEVPAGDLSGFLERLETLAAENGRFKALQEVNETERQRLEAELFKTRAEVQQLEEQLRLHSEVVPRRRSLFRRSDR